MSIEIKSDILAKELNQGIVPLGVPKAYQYDAALVEAARAAVNQGLDDVAEAGATAKAAIETQKTASVNAVSAQEQASKADVNALGDKILAQMKHGYGYPFTAATAAAMADTTKIYVYVGSESGYTNGNWYYWNGTAWTSGGVYNATALETDKTLTVSGAAADAKVVGDICVKMRDSYNLIDTTTSVSGFLTSAGNISGNGLYKTSDFIPVKNGVPIKIMPRLRKFLAYNQNKGLDYSTWIDADTANYIYTPTYNGYIRFSYRTELENQISVIEEINDSNYEYYEKHSDKFFKENLDFNSYQKNVIYGIVERNSYNILDPSTSVQGYLTSAGNVVGDGSYKTSDFIPVKAFVPICFSPQIRKFLAYNGNKARDDSTWIDAVTVNYIYTPTQDGYIRFSYNVAFESQMMVSYNNSIVEYESPNDKYFVDNINFNDFQADKIRDIVNVSGNILYEKKWVACGDSFTHGDFTNSLTNNFVLTNGKYAGQYKVYPFFIGNRNNMEVINIAQNGMTMAVKPGGNCFADTLYTQIDADADYITLYFGINDDPLHNNIPLGTIDDDVNTTFYGAWNIVLEYLITNHPLAKIGIIITNGATINYANAEIALAEKWGIPYLNMSTGVLVPTMLRTNKELPASVITTRLNAFAVNPDNNAHPNEKAHEYESTFIETWLRTL